MGPEDPDRLAALHQQRLVVLEPPERGDDTLVALPIPGRFPSSPVDDELLGPLCNCGIEVVHQHPKRGLLVPTLAGDGSPGWGGYDFGFSQDGQDGFPRRDDEAPRLAISPNHCNLLGHWMIQFPAMTELGLGVVTLEHEERSRPDSDAVDATLAASGDASAFERLYRHHLPRVYSLVRRMLNDDDADEVTQDIFVRAWQKLGTFRGEAAFGTWLHRLAVNVILARRETLGTRRKRYLEGDAALATIPTRRHGPELAMDFESAMEQLPNGAREVFVLHDVEGYRHEEIAEMLGLATGTSKSQLHRARLALRRHLER